MDDLLTRCRDQVPELDWFADPMGTNQRTRTVTVYAPVWGGMLVARESRPRYRVSVMLRTVMSNGATRRDAPIRDLVRQCAEVSMDEWREGEVWHEIGRRLLDSVGVGVGDGT